MEKRKLFTFSFSNETLIAIVAGIFVIFLSILMNIPFINQHLWATIFIRDFLMIFGMGFVFVFYAFQKWGSFEEFGITKKKIWLNLGINIVLAIALFFIMKSGIGDISIGISQNSLFKIVYILIAGAFECLFFYSFQRVIFEKSFGKIAAAILASIFYSFHHAGFQPEFLKLFFVGLSFVIVVILTNNIFSIYPFYWAVGGVLDVLVQSEVVSGIPAPFIRVILLIVLIVGLVLYKTVKKID